MLTEQTGRVECSSGLYFHTCAYKRFRDDGARKQHFHARIASYRPLRTVTVCSSAIILDGIPDAKTHHRRTHVWRALAQLHPLSCRPRLAHSIHSLKFSHGFKSGRWPTPTDGFIAFSSNRSIFTSLPIRRIGELHVAVDETDTQRKTD